MQSVSQLVGSYLRSKREARGLSVIDVALAVGKSPSFIYRLEAGDKQIPAHLIKSLSQCVGVDLRGLIGMQRSLDLNVGLTGIFLDQLNSCTHSNADEVGRLRIEVRLRCGIDLKNERNLSLHSVDEAAAHIGVPISTWFGWESGEFVPNKEAMGKLLEAPYFLPPYVAAWWRWPDRINAEVQGELSFSYIVEKFGYDSLFFGKRSTKLRYFSNKHYSIVTTEQVEADLAESLWLMSDKAVSEMANTCMAIVGWRQDFNSDIPRRMPDRYASMFENSRSEQIDQHLVALNELSLDELDLVSRATEKIVAERGKHRVEVRKILFKLPSDQLKDCVERALTPIPRMPLNQIVFVNSRFDIADDLKDVHFDKAILDLEGLQQLIGGDADDLKKFLGELLKEVLI
jgi:transcriptional regulator with XRE-family HTH domain